MNTLASIERDGSPIIVAANGAAPSGGSGPVERSSLARPVLPCPGCAHTEVCAIRPLLATAELAFRTPPSPHAAIRVRLTVEVECDHFLPGVAAPVEPAPIREDAARLAESRKRGTAAQVAARKVARGADGHKRTPEQRERMQVAQKAAWERRRAREAGQAVPE